MKALSFLYIVGLLLSAGQALDFFAAHAQDAAPVTIPAAPAATPTNAAQASGDQVLKPEELEQMVAPIALYPDPLLAQVMMASTYPLEVVQADRWAQKNKNVKGEGLTSALKQQAWDDSVKALVSTPDVLSTMSSNLDWTQKLGDAVLAQQDGVMDAVQRLRTKAYDNQKLATNEQQTVTVEQQDGDQNIIIQPAEPDTVYVPYYEPTTVYGGWDYPSYPPVYYPPPAGYGIAAGIGFIAAIGVAGDWWDDDFDWGDNDIDINVDDRDSLNVDRSKTDRPGRDGAREKWQHKPEHRHGVKYGNKDVANKFTPQKGDRQARAGQTKPAQGGAGEYRGRELSSQQLQQGLSQRQQAQRNLAQGATGQRAERPRTQSVPQRTQRPSSSELSRIAPSSGHQFQDRPQSRNPSDRGNYQGMQRQNAFSTQHSARQTREYSGRGHASMSGSRGGGARMGGGGGRGGGGRRR